MKAVILEDELLIAEELEKKLLITAPHITIVARLQSLKQARKWFGTNPLPDLLFFDIQLSDGVSFELFHEYAIDCPVIFTTAYDAFAIRAFKVNSIDYLLKPIDNTDLKYAIDKFSRIKQPTGGEQDLAKLVKEYIAGYGKQTYKERFIVNHRNAQIPIDAQQIACIYRDELVYILTTDNQKYILDHFILDEIEGLIDPHQFFRANRQYIVNLNIVESYKSHYTGKLTVKLGSPLNLSIDVSREKAYHFKKWLSKEQ